MRHAQSTPNFGGGGGYAPASTLFVPPPDQESIYTTPPPGGDEQSYLPTGSGVVYGNGQWGETSVVPHDGRGVAVVDVVADAHQDLLWSATADGHVCAQEFPSMTTYCAYWAAGGSEVRAIVPTERVMVSVCDKSVRVHSRTGMPRSTLTAPDKLSDLYAATLVQAGQVALGGLAPSLFMFDVETNRLSLQVGTKAGCTVLQAYRSSVYGGQTDGSISVLDPRTFRSASSLFSGFAGGVQSMDVKDKLLCCSGYATDRHGAPYLDGLVRIFDLRMMRAVAPIGFASGAYRLKFHPVFSGTMILMAQNGQLQISDAHGSHSSIQGYHVDAAGGLLMAMSVSSSGESIVMSDSNGYLHQWADRDGARLNLYPRPLDEPTPVRQLVPVLPDEEMVSLSMLDTGVWAFKSPGAYKDLLSTWPSSVWFRNPAPETPIPASYLANLKPARDGDFIAYSHVPLNPGLIRYQWLGPEPVRYVDMAVLEEVDLRSSLEAFSPARHMPSQLHGSVDGTAVATPDSVRAASEAEVAAAAVAKPPGIYQEKTISYSRLGVSGFDFKRYNSTAFSGLENTLTNSYINAALQMLFFLVPVRRALQGHLCEREFCFSCELGFLFRMLESSGGEVCQASNLLRVLDRVPLARELHLLAQQPESFTDQAAGIALLERFVTFLLRQMQAERTADDPDVVASLMTCPMNVVTKCRTCGHVDRRDSSLMEVVRLLYPEDTSTQLTFGALLCTSLTRQWTGTRPDSDEWCNPCGNKQPSAIRMAPSAFPPVMVVSSGLGALGPRERAMWKSVGISGAGAANSEDAGFFRDADSANGVASWLPSKLKVSVDASTGAVQVEELASEAVVALDAQSAVYRVTALLCHVHDPRKFPGPGHSVLHQKIEAEHTSDKKERAWHLFNDFQVVKTSAREALSFDAQFKNAAVLILSRVERDEAAAPDASAVPARKTALVSSKAFFTAPLARAKEPRAYVVRSEDDLPRAGELLAIDAEFVSLAPEINKTLANGAQVLMRPMHLSLARVSVLREDGRVLIDDYIHACEPVDNYLTRYSGLREGDLDPDTTTHTLVKLKTVYLKLLWLVERGCVFVGHGLSKDFRILNIHVPARQIQDTVDLFHLPRSRKISLRFLASYLLDLEIQAETHDSIEDAQTAIAVYRKYQEMTAKGTFDDELQKLYDTGRAISWMTTQLGAEAPAE